MPDLKSKAEKTRNRLLVTASRIFAQHGFHATTIADICEQAETNIASVNYHFGDKETLYLESWRFAFTRELLLYPPDGGIVADAPAEQRLAGRINALVARIADVNSHSFAIIHKEMAQPTRLLADILEKEINPQRLAMLALLQECLGQSASAQQIQFCHLSIMGQCLQLLRLQRLQGVHAQAPYPQLLNTSTAFAEHVVQFSLAGIRALRTQNTHAST